MPRNTAPKTTATVISDAYLDLILSKKAARCSEKTLERLDYTLAKGFVKFLQEQGLTLTSEISSRHVRIFMASLLDKKVKRGQNMQSLSDLTLRAYAQDIKTMLRFFAKEKYCSHEIEVEMPKLEKKQKSFLTVNDLHKVIDACDNKRDKAIILFMVDSGVRREELCKMNWGNVDIASGVITVVRGKGGRFRSCVIGAKTRRALMAYQRELDNHEPDAALFQTHTGTRITPDGLRAIIDKLSSKSGVKFSPHSLRRTFATLAIKAGINIVHLQGLMGHSTVGMTRAYIQDIEPDILQAHHDHGPIDKFL